MNSNATLKIPKTGQQRCGLKYPTAMKDAEISENKVLKGEASGETKTRPKQ